MVRYSEFNENQNEDKIRSLLKEYFRIDGNISIENGLINIKGSIELVKKCDKLPVKFGKVSGNFSCSDNQLTSLTGSPSHVGGGFSLSRNQLTSLIGSPSYVSGNFYCTHNQLTSLTGSPSYVGGSFYCSYNQLTSLSGSPSHIKNDFLCYNNPLISLEGITDNIEEDIHIDWNKNLPLLRLLKYKHVNLYENDNVEIIIKKYCKLVFSRSNLIQCQRELIDSGYESNAKW